MWVHKLISFYLSSTYHVTHPGLALAQTGRWPCPPLIQPEASSEAFVLP